MELVILLAQTFFVIFMLSIILLFSFILLLTWAWAQQRDEETSIIEVFSTTSIEFGALLTLLPGQLFPPSVEHEAPPLSSGKISSTQVPIVFVPSLHTGRGIFTILFWRFKKHFFTSLWPFEWKSFLKKEELLEDQILEYFVQVIHRTKSNRLHILSFGSSRKLVGRALLSPQLSGIEKKWIAISGPRILGQVYRFLSTARIRSLLKEDSRPEAEPHLLIRGTHDVLCFPDSVWGETRQSIIHRVGHYSTLLHPTTVQRALQEFSE